MKSVFVTKEGNLLVAEGNKNYFVNETGRFLRVVGTEEAEFLKGILPGLEPKSAEFWDSLPKELPVWQFLWETRERNFTNFEADRSTNGGGYLETTTNYYFGRKIGSVVEFCCLSKISSGSDFSQTDEGEFQEDITYVQFMDVSLPEYLKNRADHYKVWSRGGRIKEGTEASILQHATSMSLDQALCAVDCEIEGSKSEASTLTGQELQKRKKLVEDLTGPEYQQIDLRPFFEAHSFESAVKIANESQKKSGRVRK